MVIGCACLSTLDPVPNIEAKMYGFQVFVGLGFGFMVSTVSLGASLECELRDRSALNRPSPYLPLIDTNRHTAVAQGIIAQARVLGGSLGIAASTAILGVMQARYLSGLVSPSDLAILHSSSASFAPAQLLAVRKAYSDSFSESMKVCAAVSGACVLVTLLTYRKRPMVIMERRREQVEEYVELMAREGREMAMKEARKRGHDEENGSTTT